MYPSTSRYSCITVGPSFHFAAFAAPVLIIGLSGIDTPRTLITFFCITARPCSAQYPSPLSIPNKAFRNSFRVEEITGYVRRRGKWRSSLRTKKLMGLPTMDRSRIINDVPPTCEKFYLEKRRLWNIFIVVIFF